jgi:hypothetical protein
MQLAWVICILVLVLSGRNHAQTPRTVYQARSAMAQSTTVNALRKIHEKFGLHDRITELVFFSRWLALAPRSTAAARGLLQTVPATEGEALELMALSDPPEGTISIAEMSALANIHDQWPRLVAHAAVSLPESMGTYVAFLPLATIDMHSDFTGNAQQVCNRFPKQFRVALDALSQEDRQYVRKIVFDAEKCRAIFVGEAE